MVQIAGGHEISACLTSSGDVIAWTPPLSADFDALDQEQTGQYRRSIAWGKIPDICKCLPTIPTVQAQHKLESTNDTDTIVKIACGASFVVALKANGQIWVWHAAQNIELNSWIYVSPRCFGKLIAGGRFIRQRRCRYSCPIVQYHLCVMFQHD